MDEPIALLDGLCDLNSDKRMTWYTNYWKKEGSVPSFDVRAMSNIAVATASSFALAICQRAALLTSLSAFATATEFGTVSIMGRSF